MIIFITLFAISLILLYKLTTINHDYWEKRGVPYKKPLPFFGNMFNVMLKIKTIQMSGVELYKEFEGHRFFGSFFLSKPCLTVRDVNIVAKILKSEFSRFPSRGLYIDHKKDPLSVNLFFMEGKLWKRTRELLRVGFKSGRLRSLVPLIEKSAKIVFGEGDKENCVEVKYLSKRFAAAVIAGPVLGFELNNVTVNMFLHHCNESFNIHGWRAIPVIMRLFMPRVALALGMKAVLQATEDFFKDIAQRAKRGREGVTNRDDYLQTIISSINRLPETPLKELNEEFLSAALSGNLFVFVLAGFETTASTLASALFHLAHDQNICDLAREDIMRVKGGERGNFTYDDLKEMKYLENVINEVLRMHPPIAGFMRVCTATYQIPGTDIVLQPGDTIQIPLLSIQNDPKYFEDPDVFRPSRFDKPILEGTFIPFADGPRNCLGMRLALMELKIALAYIIANYNLSMDPRAPDKLDIDPEHLITMPTSNLWIRFTPI